MSKSARRLGRGLDSLVSNLALDASSPGGAVREGALSQEGQAPHAAVADLGATSLPVEALRSNPRQPRRNIDRQSILSITESIRRSGIIQPILVRSVAGRYEIIAGERRWLAAKSLGMAFVPVVIRDATDEQMLELALIENIQREDLNPIDRAKAYREFCERFGIKPDEVAARLGEDRTTVVNYLRLLDLPETIESLVAAGKLSMGHARCLLGVKEERERVRLAEGAAENQLSVRALEEIVRRRKTRDQWPLPVKKDLRPAHLHDLERRFEEAVKTKVTIHQGKRKGTGRVVIEYYSLDDFDRIAAMLRVPPE